MTLPPFQTLYFEDLRVGMSETYAKTVEIRTNVVGFAEITGDRNPIHLSEHFAAKTPFKGRIAHGLYTAGLISAIIGTRLPGPGAIYTSQLLNFKAPVRIGDTVTASVEVVELIADRHRAEAAVQMHGGRHRRPRGRGDRQNPIAPALTRSPSSGRPQRCRFL